MQTRVPQFIHDSDQNYQPDHESTYYYQDTQTAFHELPRELQRYYALAADMCRLMQAAQTNDQRRWLTHVHPYFSYINASIQRFQQQQ